MPSKKQKRQQSSDASQPTVAIPVVHFINAFCRRDLSDNEIMFISEVFDYFAATHERGQSAFYKGMNAFAAMIPKSSKQGINALEVDKTGNAKKI